MKNIILMLIAVLYSMINYYIGYKICIAIKNIFDFNATIPIGITFSVFSITTIATYLLSSTNVGSIMGKIGSYWFGFSMLTFVIFLLSEIIIKIAKAFLPLNISLSYIALVNVFIICIVFFYSTYQANQLQVTNYSIGIDKKSDIDNLNIILISDLHLGYINDNEKLRKAVDKINQQNPDIVVIAGDLFDGNFEAVQSPDETKNILNNIKTKYGTYLALGNHDAGSNFQMMREFITQTDIVLLEDKLINVENKFIIVGRKDPYPIGNQGEPRQKEYKELQLLETDLPVIVLDHQPSNLEEHMNTADLILSGHTHKGQVFPFNLVTKHYFTVDYGYYKVTSGAQVIVTSGLGTWGPPMRLGTDNEIVKITVNFIEPFNSYF